MTPTEPRLRRLVDLLGYSPEQRKAFAEELEYLLSAQEALRIVALPPADAYVELCKRARKGTLVDTEV